MARKNSHLTVTDQFCGAGGSSQGARRLSRRLGGGLEVKLALNHWKLAIETHNTNFPDTMHDCTDVSACDPRRYPSTDILITSPECTTHSPAGGNNHKTLKKQMDMFDSGEIDPATERSRATMWDVCRFAEYHQYNAIIVENVVEAKTRWPLFDHWLGAMHILGYEHRCVYLNSMHCHPTPQSRDRMYIVFWKKGNRAPALDYTPLAWCEKCSKDINAAQTWKNPYKKFGKYRQQYVYCCTTCTATVEPYYYAAMNIIDWSDIGTRIGDRKKPLSSKTMARIEYGLKKYGGDPIQFHVAYASASAKLVRSVFDAAYTQSTANTQGIVVPFIIKLEHGGKVSGANEKMPTQTTRHSQMLVSNIRSTLEYMQTQTTAQGMGIVTPGFTTENYGTGGTRELTEALNTVTAGGVKTGLVTNESFNAFIAQYYGGSHCTSHFTEQIPAVTCKDRSSLITYKEPSVEDCYYRMLKPFETKLAMAFERDYIILGSSKDQVRQCGNAVTPPAMEWLIQQVVTSLS
jgi:DNA (cytosine-5)-methyltransferase 1